MKKNDKIASNNEQLGRDNYSKSTRVPTKETVEVAMDYVADRFGRALTRLSDR